MGSPSSQRRPRHWFGARIEVAPSGSGFYTRPLWSLTSKRELVAPTGEKIQALRALQTRSARSCVTPISSPLSPSRDCDATSLPGRQQQQLARTHPPCDRGRYACRRPGLPGRTRQPTDRRFESRRGPSGTGTKAQGILVPRHLRRGHHCLGQRSGMSPERASISGAESLPAVCCHLGLQSHTRARQGRLHLLGRRTPLTQCRCR